LEELETSAEEISAIEAEVKEEIADAVRFADSSPPADEYLSYVIKE
jgi:TPP-dependent pyruvate/acetoin dehydrogenase alpha subunit